LIIIIIKFSLDLEDNCEDFVLFSRKSSVLIVQLLAKIYLHEPNRKYDLLKLFKYREWFQRVLLLRRWDYEIKIRCNAPNTDYIDWHKSIRS